MNVGIALIIALVSMVVPLQVACFNQLRGAVGSTPLAAAISMLVGGLGVGLFSLTGAFGRGSLFGASNVVWWAWLGGLLLAAVIVVQTEGLQRAGAGATVAATVLGQLLAALIVEHFGWLEVERVPLSLTRVLGAVLLVGGTVLLQKR